MLACPPACPAVFPRSPPCLGGVPTCSDRPLQQGSVVVLATALLHAPPLPGPPAHAQSPRGWPHRAGRTGSPRAPTWWGLCAKCIFRPFGGPGRSQGEKGSRRPRWADTAHATRSCVEYPLRKGDAVAPPSSACVCFTAVGAGTERGSAPLSSVLMCRAPGRATRGLPAAGEAGLDELTP
ncbi:hypothetical protein HJG60_009571 [Phyllostomus discolor]|uniref:Uncharacterized protein n=1 Tax=Phyllostomus discolor TaxID=89673 RepID=A0A834DC30_9CHIR|nr:hypothetical protein HJG60_009571 [Phyllostomus discolor]